MPELTFEELAKAVDDAAAAVAQLHGAPRKAADDLRTAIEAAHRAALVTIVRRLRTDETGRALLFELVDDPMVHLLFSLHGIIRPDPVTAARSALEEIRPGLRGHGGDVELVRIAEGTAYVAFSGACNGCSMASVTMRDSVEQALLRAVPSISSVEVVPSEPGPAVIPLSAVRRREDTPEELASHGWVHALPAAQVPDGQVTALKLTRPDGQPAPVIVVRIGDGLAAFDDRCAHQSLPLGAALVDAEAGTLTCPWHGFCYDARTGECLSAPGATLEQRPLRMIGGDVWVQVVP
ncbi:NifU family protein [Dactylosporangium sp. CA-233914]|uniref:NifU family protein n=1 Tax=Dactylosporangium sp. CA-233914 TaxID=3239934 RepID=UPI003D93525E